MNTNDLFGPRLGKLQTNALIAAVIGLVLCGIGFAMNPAQLIQSYLFTYMFWFGVTGGSLAFLMIHHCTGGGWGFVLRRPLEAATRNFPLVAIGFLPIAFGISHLYSWSNPETAKELHFQASKASYLSPGAFIARAVIYFLIFFVFTFFLNKWSKVQDERDDPLTAHKLNLLSAPGLVVYMLVMTLVAVDWVMSLNPIWTSSLFGVILVIGQGLSTLALMAVLIAYLAGQTELVAEEIPRRFVRDVGNLTLAFTLLWGYTNFSQWLIHWSGNMAEEVGFYVPRTTHSWLYLGAFIVAFHFFAPFLTLLSSGLKVKFTNLAKLGAFIILMRHLDLYWYVVPTFRQPEIQVNPADIGFPLLLGGIWLWSWANNIKNQALVPLHDPRAVDHWPLREATEHV